MNELEFYPGGGGGGLIVTEPDDLPRFITSNRLKCHDTAPVIFESDESGFFSAIDLAGAKTTISSANSWKTIVNITGKGLLGNVIAPHSNNLNKTVDIRVTVDGKAWTWTETLSLAITYGTLFLGALSPTIAGGDVGFPVYTRESDYAGDSFQNGPQVYPVSFLLSAGCPVLGFAQSLKVEVRSSVYSTSFAGNYCACTYVLR